MAHSLPSENSCWFCHDDSRPMVLSREFDCLLHLDCLRKAIKKEPDHPENEIFAYEFKHLLEKK